MGTDRTEPIQSSKSRSESINAQTRTDLVERHLAPFFSGWWQLIQGMRRNGSLGGELGGDGAIVR